MWKASDWLEMGFVLSLVLLQRNFILKHYFHRVPAVLLIPLGITKEISDHNYSMEIRSEIVMQEERENCWADCTSCYLRTTVHPQGAENCDASMILSRPSADAFCTDPCTKREIKDQVKHFLPRIRKCVLPKMRGDTEKKMLEVGGHLKTDERKSVSYTMSYGLLGFINAEDGGYWYYQLVQEALG